MIHAIAHALLIYAAAAFLHELGHASAALVFGVRVNRIGIAFWKVFPIGFFTERTTPRSRFVSGFISAAGPITSVAFFLLSCMEGWNAFALMNLSIVAVSLISDGRNVAEACGLVGGFRIRARLAEYGR